MANTVTSLGYSNTFGNWLVTTNSLVSEINDLAANNYTKTSGTLFLNEPGISLQSNGTSVFASQVQVQGLGSSLYVQNSSRTDGTAYLQNTQLSLVTSGQANVGGPLLALGSNNGLQVANSAAINGTLYANGSVRVGNTLNVVNTTNLNALQVGGVLTATNTINISGRTTVSNVLTATTFNSPGTVYVDGVSANSQINTLTLNASALVSTLNLQADQSVNTALSTSTTANTGTLNVFGKTTTANVFSPLSYFTNSYIDNLQVNGNFVVVGRTINASNTITLNDGILNATNAYITVARGNSGANASIKWNEGTKNFEIYDVTGATYNKILLDNSIISDLSSNRIDTAASSLAANTLNNSVLSIRGVDLTQNTNISNLQSNVIAINGSVAGVNAYAYASNTWLQANDYVVWTYANAAFNQANVAYNLVQNSSAGYAAGAANAAYLQANAAYNQANTANTRVTSFLASNINIGNTAVGVSRTTGNLTLQGVNTDGYSTYLVNPSSSTNFGLNASYVNNSANSVVRTDNSGYTQLGIVSSSIGSSPLASAPPVLWGLNGTDNFLKAYNSANVSVGFASNIPGGTAGQIVYQSAAGTTGFVSVTATNNSVMLFNTATNTPYWTQQSNINAGTATYATNLNGGTTTQIPYQSGAGATSFITAPSVTGTYLQWNGTNYTWSTPAGGTSLSSFSVTTAAASNNPGLTYNNLTGVFTYTPAALSNYVLTSALSSSTVGTATNLAGGTAGAIPYQSSSGTTTYLGAGTNGYVLTMNSNGLPTWKASTGGVTTFNGNSGAITYGSSDIISALGYTPYNSGGSTVLTTSNWSSYVTSVSYATSAGSISGVSGTIITSSNWSSYISAGNAYTTTSNWSPSSGTFSISGSLTATSYITAYYSDMRLKTKVGNIENALDKVEQLSGFLYVENDVAKDLGFNNTQQQVALSAQDVQKVQPEAVSLAPFDRDDNGNSKSGENYLTVNYERLVPLLVEAIKELRAEVKDIKDKIGK